MIKRIRKDDYSIRPYKAYKLWQLNQASSGIGVFEGQKNDTSSFYSASDAQSNGEYKRLVYNQINQLYYQNQTPYTIIGQKGKFEENIRTIHTYCNVLSIPHRYFGEQLHPTSISIVDGITEKTYTDDGKGNLLDSSNSLKVGNVIYPHGLVIMTHSASAYTASFTDAFTLNFRGTVTNYEHEVFLEVLQHEFNVSTNPTAYVSDSGSAYYGYIRKIGVTTIPGQGEVFYNLNYTSSYDGTTKGGFADYDYSSSIDPTGSYLAPYITTIGLYNDNVELVAVAKLAKPIKSIHDFPINFIVRFDI